MYRVPTDQVLCSGRWADSKITPGKTRVAKFLVNTWNLLCSPRCLGFNPPKQQVTNIDQLSHVHYKIIMEICRGYQQFSTPHQQNSLLQVFFTYAPITQYSNNIEIIDLGNISIPYLFFATTTFQFVFFVACPPKKVHLATTTFLILHFVD